MSGATEGYAQLGELYRDEWYAGCRDGSIESARLYTDYLWRFIQPDSVMDAGCGRGHWLNAWREKGVRYLFGFDGRWNSQEQMSYPSIRFQPADLNLPFNLGDKVDLAMSLEVAEHLQPASASTFIACLAHTSDVILFGAAFPHQGGPSHLNEQPATYWARLFLDRGFVPLDVLRPVFWADDRIPFWYRQNTFLYVRNDSGRLKDFISQGLKPMEHIGFMDCVHPALYACKIQDIAAARSC